MKTAQQVVPATSWRKSTYCDTGGQCVEVTQTGTTYLVRDSQNHDGGCLTINGRIWAAFISDVKDGAYTE
jgi:hypothetical protein